MEPGATKSRWTTGSKALCCQMLDCEVLPLLAALLFVARRALAQAEAAVISGFLFLTVCAIRWWTWNCFFNVFSGTPKTSASLCGQLNDHSEGPAACGARLAVPAVLSSSQNTLKAQSNSKSGNSVCTTSWTRSAQAWNFCGPLLWRSQSLSGPQALRRPTSGSGSQKV